MEDPFADHDVRVDSLDVTGDERFARLLELPRGLVDWRSLSAADAYAAWAALRDWILWLRREFAFDHRVVPPCWYRHPALVSVISALHDHWRAAYDPLNSLLGPSDWHRAFVQLEPRLREWASRTGCTASMHRADVVADYPDDSAEWEAHVAADVAARTAGEAAGSDDD